MALHDLIRDYVKNNQGKHFVYERLIRDIISYVSEEHQLNEMELLQTCETFLGKKKETKVCKGVVASKNNYPCTCPAVPGEDYCKRHLSSKEPEFEPNCCQGTTKAGAPCSFRATQGNFCKRHQTVHSPLTKTRCCGENHDGTRCVRDARDGYTLCGLHKKKKDNDALKKNERMPCAFYNINDDLSFCFCSKLARNDQWFCNKHEHLQTQYTSIYKSKNLKEYLSDPNYEIDVIEQLLKENEMNITK